MTSSRIFVAATSSLLLLLIITKPVESAQSASRDISGDRQVGSLRRHSAAAASQEQSLDISALKNKLFAAGERGENKVMELLKRKQAPAADAAAGGDAAAAGGAAPATPSSDLATDAGAATGDGQMMNMKDTSMSVQDVPKETRHVDDVTMTDDWRAEYPLAEGANSTDLSGQSGAVRQSCGSFGFGGAVAVLGLVQVALTFF